MFRVLLVCAALILVLVTPADAGRYQRTKDRKIRVWNEHPERWDEGVWTGGRDQNGNATGPGVLMWYHVKQSIEMGELIPSARGRALLPVASFTGTMVDGRFEGIVVTTDDNGKEIHAKYADGSRTEPWSEGSGAKLAERATKKTMATAPAGEPPAPAESPPKIVRRSAVVEAPTQDSQTLDVFRPPSSLRASYAAPTPSDETNKDPSLAQFKEQTDSAFSQVRDATGNFREIENLNSVQPFPASVAKNVQSLAERGRALGPKGADNGTLQSEATTSDALFVAEETTSALASKDATGADLKLTQFLNKHPAPPTDAQKPLWRYLTSTRDLCDRRQQEADAHVQQAQSLLAAGRTKEAIAEYEAANRLFPSPLIAEKIRQLASQLTTANQP